MKGMGSAGHCWVLCFLALATARATCRALPRLGGGREPSMDSIVCLLAGGLTFGSDRQRPAGGGRLAEPVRTLLVSLYALNFITQRCLTPFHSFSRAVSPGAQCRRTGMPAGRAYDVTMLGSRPDPPGEIFVRRRFPRKELPVSKYSKFGAMIATSTVVMLGLMYLNTLQLDHVYLSETRAYMALVMGATMAIIMLGFMRHMYPNR